MREISTGDFNKALGLLRQEASGLSASTINQLTMRRATRSLAGTQHEYLWPDSLHLGAPGNPG